MYRDKNPLSFNNVSNLFKMIFEKILMNLADKTQIRKLSFRIQMSIINFTKEKFSLEVALKNGFLFGKECFTFICYAIYWLQTAPNTIVFPDKEKKIQRQGKGCHTPLANYAKECRVLLEFLQLIFMVNRL